MIGTMKNNSVLYTPRQVATFYSIRKDTLLYYDRIGLFQPEIRKENGYRYYSASQLAELDTILFSSPRSERRTDTDTIRPHSLQSWTPY